MDKENSALNQTKTIKEPLKPALKKPPNTGKEEKRHINLKEVQVEENKELFKGLIFYLDVANEEGRSLNEYYAQRISSLGGKVSKRVDKNVTHVVWSHGKMDTLGKIIPYDDIKIVSTLWVRDCMELMQIQEEESYQPFEIEQKLKEAQKSKLKALTKQLNQKNSNKNLKRTLADMSQRKSYQKTGNSKRGSQLANRETESETEPASQGQDKPKLDDA